MLRILHVLCILASANAALLSNKSYCDGFEANFSLREVLGPWHIVAIVPDRLYPDHAPLTCYKVEFSETDEAGLRWLMNSTVPAESLGLDEVSGPVLRQRYRSEVEHHVWSQSVGGVSGCFQRVFETSSNLNTNRQKLNSARTNETKEINDILNTGTGGRRAIMQLHLVQGPDPLLLQLLWGDLVSAVVYTRDPMLNISADQLTLVSEFLSQRRGPQRSPKTCSFVINPVP